MAIRAEIRSGVGWRSGLLVVLCVLGGGLATAQASKPDTRPSLAELKKLADKAIATPNNVVAAKHAPDVFAYTDRLTRPEERRERKRYLEAGLRLDPWALRQQLALAHVLSDLGDPEAAKDKAEMVFRYAEDGPDYLAAAEMLGEKVEVNVTDLAKPDPATWTIVLIPVEDADLVLCADIRDALERHLKAVVRVERCDFRLPKPTNDPYRDYIAQLREMAQEVAANSKLDPILKKQKHRRADLADDAILIEVYREWVKVTDGAATAEQLDEVIAAARSLEKQYDGLEILNALNRAVNDFRTPRATFVAIARRDLVMKDTNYVFGSATARTGVMSYCRFRGAFNDEAPNRARLLKRTICQALSTVGITLGVERCTDPTCARAYPRSLADQDAKLEQLCRTCQRGFQARLGKQ